MMFQRKPVEPPKPLTPSQMERVKAAELVALEADLKRREIEAAAAFQAELAENERAAKRAELASKAKEVKARQWSAKLQAFAEKAVPYTPLVLVNSMAILGQVGWGRHNLTQVGSSDTDILRWIVALLFAAALESIALFVIFYANKALQNRDSANGLYLAAFAVASLVAGINYSHYAHVDKAVDLLFWKIPAPTPMAVVFAMCSMISPWLWRIHHRAKNREDLKKAGEIDVRAVKLSMARKIFHPVKSFRVIRRAAWSGITTPADAVADWEAFRAERAAAKAEARAAKEDKRVKTQDQPKDKAPAAPSEPETVVERVDEGEVPAEVVETAEAPKALPAAELPDVAHKWAAAWKVLDQTHAVGNPISQRQLAANYLNNNRSGARELVAAHREWRLRSVNGSGTAAP